MLTAVTAVTAVCESFLLYMGTAAHKSSILPGKETHSTHKELCSTRERDTQHSQELYSTRERDTQHSQELYSTRKRHTALTRALFYSEETHSTHKSSILRSSHDKK